ncbi:MAG: hypothetical protein K0U60_06540 [Actinomycetia bacterium]|nr:hypothetical protein [Actinomycetes bacterium]MCH9801429.1 hypothetical protein [Actinomycetes bacterium]
MTSSPTPAPTTEVAELIGIYHADGGLVGEATYVIGHLLGRAHCALCDITHSPFRRKPAWDAMVQRLGVEFRLLHRNEVDSDVQKLLDDHETPLVLARTDSGSLEVLLEPQELELSGSVTDFEQRLREALRGRESAKTGRRAG